MAEQETVRELLLRISGEVDPSVQAAFRKYAEGVEDTSRYMDMTQERMDKMLVKFVEGRRGLEGWSEVWKEYTKTLQKADSEQEKAAKSGKKLEEEGKKTTTVFEALMHILEKNVVTVALFGAGIGVVVLGLRKLFSIAGTVRTKLAEIFRAGIAAARDFGKRAVSAIQEIAKSSIELNSSFQQSMLYLQAIAQSEQGAATLMKVIREEATRTGTSMEELAEVAPRLVPYSKGDVDRFRELLQLTARVHAMRPDLPISIAVRAMQQFLSGYTSTLSGTFGVSTALIKKFTEELGNTPEALDTILSKMRIGEGLVEAQAASWQGLSNTLRDFGQRSLRNITAPAFDLLQAQLSRLVEWLKTNAPQIRALTVKLGEDMGAAFADIGNEILGPDGLSEDTLFKAAEWGANLIASLVEGILWGINNVLIPAVIQITQIIAMYLKGSSPPRWGLLATIDKWFGPVLRAYLGGFTAADFTAMADIGQIIKAGLQTAVAMGEITKREMNERLIDARKLTVQLVNEFRTLGGVSAATWGALGNMIGMDTQLVSVYLDLVNRVNAATQALAAAQAAYAAAMEKVRDIQEEIRLFELETAEIPERYKRGRRMELEFKLMAAQKEAQLRQEAVKAAQEQLSQAKEMLNAYKQMLQALYDLAKDVDTVMEDAEEDKDDMFDFGPIVGAGDQVEELSGKFKDLYDSITEAFKGAREQMEFLVDFIRGLMGKPAFEGDIRTRLSEDVPEGWLKGQQVAEAIQTIAENFYKVSDAIGDVGQKIKDMIEWWQGAPEWLKKLLKVGTIGIGINWVTGGLGAALLKTLGGAAIALGGKIVGGILALPILGIALAAGAGATIASELAKALGLPGVGQFVKELQFVLKFRKDETGSLGKAINATLEEAAAMIYERHKWFKWLVDIIEGIVSPEAMLARAGEDGVKIPIKPDPDSAKAYFQEALKSIRALFTGDKDALSEAVQDGLVAPIVEGAEEVEEITVGESIFPDMIDAILQLFTQLPIKLQLPLSQFVNVIRVYGTAAALWWRRSITMMRDDLAALISTLRQAEAAIMSYQAVAAQNRMTPQPSGGRSTPQGHARGGMIDRLETALLHPGEVILNIAQQRNVVAAMAGGGLAPQAGFGAGAMSIDVHQTEWTFNGTPNEEEVKRLVREGTYEGISDVVGEVLR